MKKSIFLFFAAILCATSAWAGWNLPANGYIYFVKPAEWTYAQFMIGHGGWSTAYGMTKITNTNSLYYVKTAQWDGYDKSTFLDASGSWGDDGSNPADRKKYGSHSSDVYSKEIITSSQKYGLFVATYKDTHSATLTFSKGNSYTIINKTQTIKVQLKDGSNWVDATVVPADLKASTYALTAVTTAGAKSASLAKESTTVSATVSAAYSAKVTLSCTNVLDGYVFEGWYDANGNKITSYTVSGAHTVYARFIQSAEETNEVTVTYMCGTTSVATAVNEYVGVETEKTFTAPTVTGYQFKNWTVGAGMTLKVGTENDATITVVTKSASSGYTLVANYEEVMETVYFINTGKWSDVYLHLWNGNATGTEWPGTQLTATGEKIGDYDVYSYTAKQGDHTNLLFHKKDDDSKKTGDLTWTAGKYYIYKYGNKTGWYTQAEAEELLVVIPDYYITGTIAGGWNGNEVKMTYSGDIWSHTFSASALTTGTEYKLKVTDGTWTNHWGAINGTIEGVSNDGDGNVCFKLSTVGDVTVTFDGAKITVSTTGAFYVPVVYDYYIAGDESMTGYNWNPSGLGIEDTDADGVYSHVFTNLAAGTYNFRITDGTWTNTWGWSNLENNDFVELSAGDNDNNIKLTLTAAKTVTVNYNKTTKKVSIEGLTEVTYSDITIKAYTESAAPQIWWWNGGSKCPDADKTDNPSNPGNKYTWETAPTMTAVAGEANWYEYTFKDVNDYTGICFKFKSGDKSSSNFEGVKENKCYDARDIVNAKTTECGVTPSDCLECSGIYLKGTFNSWGTDHEFMKTADANVVTTTVTITQEGNYNFKVHATDWLGNDGGTMARGGSGVETGGWTMEKDKNEVTLAADMEGDYIFTYTISTKKLTITFPVVVPQSFPNQPTTLYFHPSSEWKKGNERYAAYIYNNGADNEWINLTDANSDGIYELANPQKYAKVIICRMDKTKAENNWENKWDQIESGIEIPNTATFNTCLAFWTNCKANVPVSECTWVAPTPLTDKNWADFVTAYAGKTINAVIERSFKSGQYHTLCLPFDIPTNWLGEGTEAYQLTSIVANNTGDKLSLNATKWETIVAGKPYIIKPVKGDEYEHVIINGVTVKNASAGTNVASGDGYKATLKAVTATDGTQTNGSTEYYVGAKDGKLYNAQTNKLGLRAIIELTTIGGQPLPPKVRAQVTTGENIETGIEDIFTTDAPIKVIENGQLIIIRDGVKYNVQGQKL